MPIRKLEQLRNEAKSATRDLRTLSDKMKNDHDKLDSQIGKLAYDQKYKSSISKFQKESTMYLSVNGINLF